MSIVRIDQVDVRWSEDDGGIGAGGLGCVAVAEVSYQINEQQDRRIQQFESGGLYGIDEKGDQAYFNEIASEQLEDLREHLEHFGIKPDRHEWAFLVAQSPAGKRRHGVA